MHKKRILRLWESYTAHRQLAIPLVSSGQTGHTGGDGMSSEIFYDKAFIRVGDKYIPVVNHGSSNCFEVTARGREIPEKYWSVLNYPHTGRYCLRQKKCRRLQPPMRKLTGTTGAGCVKAGTALLKRVSSAAGSWQE